MSIGDNAATISKPSFSILQ